MMRDDEIVKLFFSRDEQAIKEVERQYGALCLQISKNIVGDERDAEECVSDAYLALWNSIPPQKPQSLRAFLLSTVRNLSLTRYHFNTAQKRNSIYDVALDELLEVIPDAHGEDMASKDQALADAINAFLKTLDAADRILFVRRYWYSDSVARLAQAFGKTPHYISVRLSRMRKKLRKQLIERGITV